MRNGVGFRMQRLFPISVLFRMEHSDRLRATFFQQPQPRPEELDSKAVCSSRTRSLSQPIRTNLSSSFERTLSETRAGLKTRTTLQIRIAKFRLGRFG